jgi:hypothetical protein
MTKLPYSIQQLQHFIPQVILVVLMECVVVTFEQSCLGETEAYDMTAFF